MSELDRMALEAIERQIRDVLSATPSPALLVRVREEQYRRLAAAHRWWMPWCLAGTVATAVLVLAIVPRFHRLPDASIDAGSLARHVTSPPVPALEPSIAGPAQASLEANIARASVEGPVMRRPRSTRREEPEVLVPPGQLEAVRAFVEAFEASPLVAQPLELHQGSVPMAPRLSEIVVAPVIVDWRAVDGNQAVDRGGHR